MGVCRYEPILTTFTGLLGGVEIYGAIFHKFYVELDIMRILKKFLHRAIASKLPNLGRASRNSALLDCLDPKLFEHVPLAAERSLLPPRVGFDATKLSRT